MSCARFQISSTNPNDQIGGGGCLCSPTKTDCAPPYAVFYVSETDSNVSPHTVISLACAKAVAAQADGETLNLSADVIDIPEADVEEVVEDDVPKL